MKFAALTIGLLLSATSFAHASDLEDFQDALRAVTEKKWDCRVIDRHETRYRELTATYGDDGARVPTLSMTFESLPTASVGFKYAAKFPITEIAEIRKEQISDDFAIFHFQAVLPWLRAIHRAEAQVWISRSGAGRFQYSSQEDDFKFDCSETRSTP